MISRTLIATAALTALLPLSATASIPLREQATYRALDACTQAIRNELPGSVSVNESFRQRQSDGSQLIFANVVMNNGGEQEVLRMTCSTTSFGNRVLEVHAEAGRWIEGREARG